MIRTLEDAARDLASNSRALQARLETLAETAYGAGDQALAETIAQQATDVAYVLPQLAKLTSIPEDDQAPTSVSDRPSREERGMRIVYVEALKLLETTNYWRTTFSSASDDHRQHADEQVAVMTSLVRRVRSMCRMAAE